MPQGPWSVGFGVARLRDAERRFLPAESDSPIARPIQVYLWYPATPEAGDPGEKRPLTLGDLVAWLGVEGSDDELDGDRAAAGRREFIDHFISVGADPDAAERLLAIEVLSRADAAAPPGRFPVVLLAAGHDGSPILHAAQAEHLASHGYVVLGAPGLGTEQRAMAFTPADVEAQVRDLAVVREYAREIPFAEAARPAIVGFSFGSGSALLLAARDTTIRAVVSLDGSIGFRDRLAMYRSAGYAGASVDVPILHLYARNDERVDLSALREARRPPLVATIDGAGHMDFTTVALFAAREPSFSTARLGGGAVDPQSVHALVLGATLSFLRGHP